MHRSQRNWGCRIHETALFGIDAVVMENERIRVSFLAGKGADLVEFNDKRRDLDFVWLTPGGIRNPLALHSTSYDTLATFIDVYPGGWQEIFPNAGEAAMWNGAQYGQHGEVSAMPWDVQIVEDDEERIAVQFSVRGIKTPCTLVRTVTMTRHSPGIRFDETLTNHSPVPFDAMWGHHITFGPPFLEPGTEIRLPPGIEAIPHPDLVEPGGRRLQSADRFAWPQAVAPDGGTLDCSIVPPPGTPSDLFYLHGFTDDAWYEIRRPRDHAGMRVSWDPAVFPYLWYWQEFGATQSYPWYGRNYNIGLEPGSSYPTTGLPDAMANGSALTIAPGQTLSLWLEALLVEPAGDGGAG